MLIIVCDECGKHYANTLQLMSGWVETSGELDGSPITLKSATIDLCDIHWPEEGATQPKNCKRLKFVWSESGPPDPPFTGPVPPPTHHSSLFPVFTSESESKDGFIYHTSDFRETSPTWVRRVMNKLK